MIEYPIIFHTKAISKSGIETPWECQDEKGHPPITCSIPKEFNGPDIGYSPEDLFTLSLVDCFIATFKVFAKKANVAFDTIEGEAHLTVERKERGVPSLSKIDMTYIVTGTQDKEQVSTLLNETEKNCLVSNAISSEKNFTYQIQ